MRVGGLDDVVVDDQVVVVQDDGVVRSGSRLPLPLLELLVQVWRHCENGLVVLRRKSVQVASSDVDVNPLLQSGLVLLLRQRQRGVVQWPLLQLQLWPLFSVPLLQRDELVRRPPDGGRRLLGLLAESPNGDVVGVLPWQLRIGWESGSWRLLGELGGVGGGGGGNLTGYKIANYLPVIHNLAFGILILKQKKGQIVAGRNSPIISLVFVIASYVVILRIFLYLCC